MMSRLLDFQNLQLKKLAPIGLLANLTSVLMFLLCAFSFSCFAPGGILEEHIFSTFIVINLMMHIWFYKIRKLRNSDFVDKEWLKTERELSLAELDTYTKLRFFQDTLMKLVLIFLFIKEKGNTNMLMKVVLFYFISVFIINTFLHHLKIIKSPNIPWGNTW